MESLMEKFDDEFLLVGCVAVGLYSDYELYVCFEARLNLNDRSDKFMRVVDLKLKKFRNHIFNRIVLDNRNDYQCETKQICKNNRRHLFISTSACMA